MGFTEAFYRLDKGLDDWLVFDTEEQRSVYVTSADWIPIYGKGFWVHNNQCPKGLYWVEPYKDKDSWDAIEAFQKKYGSVESNGFWYFTKDDVKRCACALMKGV